MAGKRTRRGDCDGPDAFPLGRCCAGAGIAALGRATWVVQTIMHFIARWQQTLDSTVRGDSKLPLLVCCVMSAAYGMLVKWANVTRSKGWGSAELLAGRGEAAWEGSREVWAIHAAARFCFL
eukprot:COSAG02_NODE_1608_length_11711_cov_5.975026_11_plen_122_part_00